MQNIYHPCERKVGIHTEKEEMHYFDMKITFSIKNVQK